MLVTPGKQESDESVAQMYITSCDGEEEEARSKKKSPHYIRLGTFWFLFFLLYSVSLFTH